MLQTVLTSYRSWLEIQSGLISINRKLFMLSNSVLSCLHPRFKIDTCPATKALIHVVYAAIRKLNVAATCDFQQRGILSSVDTDEPVQPPFKLRSSK